MSKGALALIIGIAILVVDQAIKVAVKLNMKLDEAITVFSWFQIRFIENNGMAWGMELGSKLFLSLFRILAVCLLCWYIVRLLKRNTPSGYIVLMSMICAGAAGNIFDSLFYGQIFTESTPFEVSQLTSFGTGYAPMLMGKVVDMFYFPIIDTTWPDWMPWVAGQRFVFFAPIFNFADACISVGVIALLVFYRNFLSSDLGEKKPSEAAAHSERAADDAE